MAMELPEIVSIAAKGRCVRCGHCCRRPPIVTRGEAVGIARHLSLSLEDFQAQYLNHLQDTDVWMINRTGILAECVCIFLNASRDGKLIEGRRNQSSCRIHEVKPLICKIQFCGLDKTIRKMFYAEMKEYLLSNKDYHWK
jgi:Fe-S-cluster containining protein